VQRVQQRRGSVHSRTHSVPLLASEYDPPLLRSNPQTGILKRQGMIIIRAAIQYGLNAGFMPEHENK
jgi:hypothetical protein